MNKTLLKEFAIEEIVKDIVFKNRDKSSTSSNATISRFPVDEKTAIKHSVDKSYIIDMRFKISGVFACVLMHKSMFYALFNELPIIKLAKDLLTFHAKLLCIEKYLY